MTLFAVLLLVALVSALAWGPGNHLEFAYRVYRGRHKALPPATARLLREQRDAYYYGNIAADIINFKGFGGHRNHCHRWTIVHDMNARAESPAERAFVQGYLSHLAADTIAHNHFVPYHLARYSRSKGLGHLYWEMRADRFVSETRWEVVSRLKQSPELDALDDLINQAVPRKAFSMRTNKLVFNHVLLISERDRWRRGIERLHLMAQAPLDKAFLELFRKAAVGRIRLALKPGGLEQLLHIDTNGKKAQAAAFQRRRGILRRYRTAKNRRRESEEAASVYLEGMESPPPGDGAPLW